MKRAAPWHPASEPCAGIAAFRYSSSGLKAWAGGADDTKPCHRQSLFPSADPEGGAAAVGERARPVLLPGIELTADAMKLSTKQISDDGHVASSKPDRPCDADVEV